jgi:FkbM family methyltransferase
VNVLPECYNLVAIRMKNPLEKTEGTLAGLQVAGIYFMSRVSGLVNYRGLWRGILLWGRLFPRSNSAILEQWPGARLRVHLGDAYWSRLLFAHMVPGKGYELEIERTLGRVLTQDTLFVDCGANLGYWSVFAVSMGVRDVIAVEAASYNVKRLKENAVLNGNKFSVVQMAVSDVAGKECKFLSHPIMHGAGSLDYSETDISPMHTVETVSTTTIDSLCLKAGAGRPVVIKLDVEGAEIAALEGAKDTMAKGAMVIYEELGKHADCPVTAWVLEHGFSVYFLPIDSDPIRVESVGDLKKLKMTELHAGYNLAAGLPNSQVIRRLTNRA